MPTTLYCADCGGTEFDLLGKQPVEAPLSNFSVVVEEIKPDGDLVWTPLLEPVEHDAVRCRNCREEWEPNQLLERPPEQDDLVGETQLNNYVDEVVERFPSMREELAEDEYAHLLFSEELDANALHESIEEAMNFSGRRMRREVERRARVRLDLPVEN